MSTELHDLNLSNEGERIALEIIREFTKDGCRSPSKVDEWERLASTVAYNAPEGCERHISRLSLALYSACGRIRELELRDKKEKSRTLRALFRAPIKKLGGFFLKLSGRHQDEGTLKLDVASSHRKEPPSDLSEKFCFPKVSAKLFSEL